MPVKIYIPEPLKKLTDNEREISLQAGSIAEALSKLFALYPGVAPRLLDEHGTLRRFINIYLNEEDIRFLQNQQTLLKEGDELSIVPATAGG